MGIASDRDYYLRILFNQILLKKDEDSLIKTHFNFKTMITLIIIICGLILFAGMIIANRHLYFTKDKRDDTIVTVKFLIPIAIFVIITIGSFVQPFSLKRVDAGAVGLKVNLTGDERGVSKYTYATGFVIINTWTEQFFEFATYQQHAAYDPKGVILKGGLQCTIKPTFNYSVIPGNAGDMLLNLRHTLKEIEDGWLYTAVASSIQDVANKWPVDSVFNNRELFESNIVAECNKRAGKWFIISQMQTNIEPPKSLQTSIELKNNAIQEVQLAENNKRVAEAQAQTKIATAKGDSANIVIAASAQALAINLRTQKLSPLYIEYLKWIDVDASTPRVPSTVLGNNSGGTMIQLK